MPEKPFNPHAGNDKSPAERENERRKIIERETGVPMPLPSRDNKNKKKTPTYISNKKDNLNKLQ